MKRKITIVMVRHGNAQTGQNDKLRNLTEIGQNQVKTTAEKLKDYTFNFALTSPAERAQQTGKIISPTSEFNVSETLYGVGIPDLDTMFAQLKYSPLHTYFDHPLNQALHDYGMQCAQEVKETISHLSDNSTVLIAGHAVALPATAYYLSEDESFKKACLNVDLKEAEHLVVEVEV